MSAQDAAQEILFECVAGRTLQIARVVASHYERALAETGVTPHQLTLLSMICRMESTSAREMLPFLKMDQSTLSRNLDRMVAKGWLESSPGDDDSRIRNYRLSGAGDEALVQGHAAWRKAQDWARDAFGESGVADLKSLAHTLNPRLPGADAPSE